MIASGPVLLAGQGGRDRCAAMLARAFADDPAFAYLFPDPRRRLRSLTRLFGLLFASDARHGMCLVTSGTQAATLWRAPGQAEAGRAEMLRHAVPLLAALGFSLARALRMSDAIAARFPTERFWYLHVAGCDPAAQGQGLGAAAVRAGLTRTAGQGLPTYLETATERNVAFYQGLGFEVTSRWQVAKDGPTFRSMLRAP